MLKTQLVYNIAMTDDLYIKAQELKDKLNNDPRIISLNELEKKLNENEEVMALAYQKDMAAVDYSDTLNHFSEDSKEAQESLKKLHAAKLALDSHPLVRKYLDAYKEVRELYDEINSIIFANFSANLCPKEKK